MKKLPQNKRRTPRLQVVAPPSPSWLHDDGQQILVATTVVYNATRTRIMGVSCGLLKIQLAAPPISRRANAALTQFAAERLGIEGAQISIVAGATSSRKRLQISGITMQRALLRLSPSLV